MFKAIKNFEVNGKSFKIGETVPAEFVSDRLIRAKKISGCSTVKEDVKVEEMVVLNEVLPVSDEIILTEDSSDVSVEVKEEDIE